MSENSADNDNGLTNLLWVGGFFVAGVVSGWLKKEFGEDNVVSEIMDNVVEGMTGVDTGS